MQFSCRQWGNPWLVLPILLLLGGTVYSQEQIDVEKAVHMALTQNLGLRQGAIALGTAKRVADSAWNSLYPGLSLSGSATRQNQSDSPWAVSAGANLSWSFSFAIPESIKASRLAYESGALSFREAERKIELSVRKFWLQLVANEAQIKALELSARNAQASFDQTKVKQASGLASELLLLNAQVAAESARLKFEAMQRGQEQLLLQLQVLLGLSVASDANFVFEPLKTADLPKDMAVYFDGAGEGAETQKIIKAIESAKLAKKIQFNQAFLPNFRLSWNYSENTSSRDWENWQQAGTFSATVGMNLDPLLPASAVRTNMAGQDDKLKDLELQLVGAQENFLLEKKQLLDSIQASQNNLAAWQATLKLAERSYDLNLEAWRRGTIEYERLKTAEASLLEAQVSAIQQEQNLLTSILDLEYACGLPLGAIGGEK